MSSNLKVNTILPSTGTTVTVSGISSVTSSISAGSSITGTTFYGSGANLTSLPSQLTLSNNANNRVITGGSGTNLVGETNLTFDGDTLTAHMSSATPAIIVGDSNRTGAGQHLAEFRGYWDGNHVARIVYAAGDDTSNKDDGIIKFHTTPSGGGITERLRIDSSGRTLINTTAVTNTNDTLTVKRAAGSFTEMSMTVDANTATGTHANAFVFTKSKNTYWNGLGFQSSHGHIGAIVGMRDVAGGDADQKIRIEIGGTGINASEEKTWDFLNTGNLSISDGDLVVANGHGIDFSATANGGT